MNKRQTFAGIDKALAALPSLYSTEDVKGDRPAVYLFTPSANATWVIWEFDPDTETGFGYADLGFGMGELGYISTSEIKTLQLPFGLWVEIDLHTRTMYDGYALAGATVPNFLKEKEVTS